MIDSIEISPSNRAVCVRCNKKIKKLEIRGNWAGSKICNNCINIKNLKEEFNTIKKDLTQFNNMSKIERQGYLNKLKVLKKLK